MGVDEARKVEWENNCDKSKERLKRVLTLFPGNIVSFFPKERGESFSEEEGKRVSGGGVYMRASYVHQGVLALSYVSRRQSRTMKKSALRAGEDGWSPAEKGSQN